jgi:predicted transcriptional regulator
VRLAHKGSSYLVRNSSHSWGINTELTLVQIDILTALINLGHQESKAVKSEEIAELLDRNPGSIRNQMQSLKALNLVGGVPGRKGGYRVMGAGYEALNLDNGEDEVAVPIIRNGTLVEGATASEIILNNVMRTNHCGAVIRIIGDTRNFNIGDNVEVGPTPANNLFINGKVVGRDDTMSRLVLDVNGMISVPRITIKNIVRPAVRIKSTASLQEVARILVYNGVQDALVEGGYPGLVSMTDIIREFAEGRTGLSVRDIMTFGFLTINSDAPIYDAIKMLGKTGATRLVVSEKGMPWGIVTFGDLIDTLVAT